MRKKLLFTLLFMVLSLNIFARQQKPDTTINNNKEEIIKTAFQFIGIPYKYGHQNPKTGFDCSGFTGYVYKLHGTILPRTAKMQWNSGLEIHKDSIQQGDLVFFKGRKSKTVSHVGIITKVHLDGSFTFIHASCSNGIALEHSSTSYYKSRYIGIKRISR